MTIETLPAPKVLGPEVSILPETAPGTQYGATNLTIGTKFKVLTAGQITGVQWYHFANWQPSRPFKLWNSAGVAVASGVSPAAAAVAGWIPARFTVPFEVAANETYTVTIAITTADVQHSYYAAGSLPPSLTPDLQLLGFTFIAGDAYPSGAPGTSAYGVDVLYRAGAVDPQAPNNGLALARAAILAALEVAGIKAFYGMGRFTAPCVRVYPADPWVDLSGLANGRRTQRWELWVVAGRADSVATFDELEALVSQCNAAVAGMQGWAYPAWRRPAVTEMGGTRYFACRGIMETTAEV